MPFALNYTSSNNPWDDLEGVGFRDDLQGESVPSSVCGLVSALVSRNHSDADTALAFVAPLASTVGDPEEAIGVAEVDHQEAMEAEATMSRRRKMRTIFTMQMKMMKTNKILIR